MYIEILDNQKEIIDLAINKAGTYRKLAKTMNIPKASITRYRDGGAIPEDRFGRIINFLNIDENTLKIEKLDDNWKQILGGMKVVKLKKENGTYEKQLRQAQIGGAKYLKAWHKRMKKEQPKEYQLIQHEKFKKMLGYKCLTIKGEKVRNKFEKIVADKLTELKIDYEYEPLIRRNGKWFYPDFLINKKIIIECTEWKGEIKAYQLKEKIRYYGSGYEVLVVIPKHLYTMYRILDKHLILGVDEIARVAQLAERMAVKKD